VIVDGTDNDDQITVIGTGPDSLKVSVNGGPAVPFAGVTSFRIDGRSGDDDIDVELNDLSIPTFTVVGGLPTADSDTVTISGDDGALDDPTWSPGSADAGTFAISGGQAVGLEGIERLIYDGEDDAEFLTIAGSATGNTIVHRPGLAVDAGTLQVDSLLALEYVSLGPSGAVAADGRDGTDTIVILGTQASDNLFVRFPAVGATEVFLATVEGTHIAVRGTNIENQRIDTLEGDDVVNVEARVELTGVLSILGGGPDASDVLNLTGTAGVDPIVVNLESSTIEGFGGTVSFTGVEDVNLNGNGDADTLTVNGTSLDDELTYRPTGAESGIFSNRISDDPDEPTTVFTFSAITGTFTVAGGAASADEVVVEATNSRDTITIDATNRTTNTVQVDALKAVALATDTRSFVRGAAMAMTRSSLIRLRAWPEAR